MSDVPSDDASTGHPSHADDDTGDQPLVSGVTWEAVVVLVLLVALVVVIVVLHLTGVVGPAGHGWARTYRGGISWATNATATPSSA